MTRRTIALLATTALLLACSAARPAQEVALPSGATVEASAPSAGAGGVARPTRTYAGEPLTCARGGAPCVYLTEDPTRTYATTSGAEDVAHQALWLRRPGGADLLLTESKDADRCPDRLVAMTDLRFSPDGARLFVSADCAATSSGIREVELATGRVRFIVDGTLDGMEERPGGLHLLVRRFLLDLDHDVDDPDYEGRCEYVFDVDPTTGATRRVAGPLG